MNTELDLRAANNLDMAARMVDAFASRAHDKEAEKVAIEFRDTAQRLRERAKEVGDTPGYKLWAKGQETAMKKYNPNLSSPKG